MKSGLILASLLAVTPLWVPYGAFVRLSAGNPNWNEYAGQAGSTYDAAANPAQTVGVVTYDPYAPLPPAAAPATAPIR